MDKEDKEKIERAIKEHTENTITNCIRLIKDCNTIADAIIILGQFKKGARNL